MICLKCHFDNPSGSTTCRVCGMQLAVAEAASNKAALSSSVTAQTSAASATHSPTRTDCAQHPDVLCVPCANCSTPLCAECMETGVLLKLAPCGSILCGPCHRQAVLSPGFCPDCEADVQYVEAVDNYVKGNFFSNFFGEAEQCSKCNSVVRTLWFGSMFPIGILLLPVLRVFADVELLRPHMPKLFRIAVIPLIPLASYRDRIGLVTNEREDEDQTLFQRGRTSLRGGQVLRTAMFWFIPIGIIILFLIVLASVAQPT